MNEGGVNFGLPALLLQERRPQFLDTDIRQRRKRIANFSGPSGNVHLVTWDTEAGHADGAAHPASHQAL